MSKPGERRIIVALDGTSASSQAVRWAARQSQLTGDELVLVHAYRTGTAPADCVDDYHAATESWHRAEATRWLHQALDECPATPCRLRLVVSRGTWSDVFAGSTVKDASLVVVGAGFDLSDGLVRGPACPLVVVPQDQMAPIETHSVKEAVHV
jgi:nucleotide-binding universal stress UspA family protein